eukprot:1187079-Prorocentrum_minimum.AAC.2
MDHLSSPIDQTRRVIPDSVDPDWDSTQLPPGETREFHGAGGFYAVAGEETPIAGFPSTKRACTPNDPERTESASGTHFNPRSPRLGTPRNLGEQWGSERDEEVDTDELADEESRSSSSASSSVSTSSSASSSVSISLKPKNVNGFGLKFRSTTFRGFLPKSATAYGASPKSEHSTHECEIFE